VRSETSVRLAQSEPIIVCSSMQNVGVVKGKLNRARRGRYDVIR